MCEGSKVHVFLGAPPPSPVPEAGRGPSAGWRRLELAWRDGRLRPHAAEGTTRVGWAERPEGQWDGCSASVRDYLNSCFPAAPAEPEPELAPALCTRTQYLTTWTQSQTLVLRNPPPPLPPPLSAPSCTPELFSPSPRVEEGGVVLEATTDGVLCSQNPKAVPLPSESKKAALDEGAESPRGPTTPLDRCLTPGRRYSVLVAVVHPCHLKEVKVKSGPSAGTFVPLASIVVTDQSDVEMKVVLWRRAAFWALTVTPGDILLVTGLQVNEDKWRGETVLQSTFSSKLLCLGPMAASAPPPAPQRVNARSLSRLCAFLHKRRPLLVTPPRRLPQDLRRLPYATLRSLRVNTLVHVLLRVTHAQLSSEWRSGAESRSRSAGQVKAVLTVEQPDGQQGTLLLWGSAVDWVPRFNTEARGTSIWDFHVLLVKDGLTSDLPELHSTPWSSVRPLKPGDPRRQDFLRPPRGTCSLELDLDTLLSQKYSGDVELRVQVTAFHFRDAPSSQNAPQPVLDGSAPLQAILEALSGDVTFSGCGRCGAELGTDANGIYSPCYPCLPHTATRRYYRPGVLTASGRGRSQVCVQVPPVALQKMLDAPPDKLHRNSAPGSQVKHIQVAAQRIHTLLCLPSKTFTVTVRSHFLCDENSVPLDQDFTLLDVEFP